MRALHLLGAYTRRYFLRWMAGRSFLLTTVANEAVTPLIGLAVWTTALPGRAGLSTYYVAILAVQLLTVSYEQYLFAERIYDGALVEDLLHPHPVVLVPLGENVAVRTWHFLLGLPVLAAVALLTRASFEPNDLVMALPALALAAILRFLFTYTLALLAFWTQKVEGIVGVGETLIFLLGGSAAPIALFPQSVRPLAEALPFGAMLGFPAELATGSVHGADVLAGYGWQALWIGAFALASALTWQMGLRRYTALGG